MAKIRLLISDNSRDFVWLLVEYLSKYRQIEIIGVAYDGRQTIKMIEQAKPGVVLLDLIMPDIDGLQVMERVREVHAPLKIFVLSAIGDDDLIEKVKDLGAAQYFIKPVDLNKIVSAVLESI